MGSGLGVNPGKGVGVILLGTLHSAGSHKKGFRGLGVHCIVQAAIKKGSGGWGYTA